MVGLVWREGDGHLCIMPEEKWLGRVHGRRKWGCAACRSWRVLWPGAAAGARVRLGSVGLCYLGARGRGLAVRSLGWPCRTWGAGEAGDTYARAWGWKPCW